MLMPLIFFTLADVGLVWLLLRFVAPAQFRQLGWTMVAGSSLYWGAFGALLIAIYWKSYYSFFAPGWVWVLTPTLFVTYGLIGGCLYWVSRRLPGNPLVNFVILGGIESVPEHMLGIYGFKILEVVPMLQGFSPADIFIFAVFEYVLYWGLVVALAAFLKYVWGRWLRSRPAASV